MDRMSVWCVGFLAGAALAAPAAWALPPNFISEPVGSDWNQAVGVAFAPGGRMFVWEKGGRVWNVENGVKADEPLIDISEEVGDWRDFGLLGFAIDPDFSENGRIYLLYVVDYHHLRHFGTPQYNPQANQYFHDTIGRLTRYTCTAAGGFRSVDYGTRHVLIGETITAGFPICHQSHGIGSLVFGEDGTLLASCGDGASYETVDTGGPVNGSSNTARADGIIRAAEDVGAYRSQLVDSLSGKIVRIDPATGDGVPSNPFYDAARVRAPQSRVWAMGLRNPFRTALRPGSGSPDPAAGDPGTLCIGDVGWFSWEELNVCTEGGANLGWPAFEGMEVRGDYWNSNTPNRDAPNPLFGTTPPGRGPCTQQFFFFRNLIVQDTLDPDPSFPNPCDPNQQVPATVGRFVHRRPSIDWGHGGGPSRAPVFSGQQAAVVNVGAPGSPVQGPQFGGNSSTGGVWYTGTDFPAEYRGTYFQAEFGGRWIRNVVFDEQDRPTLVRDFELDAGAIVGLGTDPVSGGLYYVNYDESGMSTVRRVSWVNNAPPTAVATADREYGPAPLAVQFAGGGSSDPEGQALEYRWDFGDGAGSSLPNPAHTFRVLEDITAEGAIIARVFSLVPPHPIGGGNWDPEIIRDGDFPPVGNEESSRQYDTYHGGDQGATDWIGYTFPGQRRVEALVFQEGKHFHDGGWFDGLQVQSRNAGGWRNVTGLTVTPAYPGNNGVSYETFSIRFDPVGARSVRIYGNPGGSAGFISVGELRVLAEPSEPITGPVRRDVTLTVTDPLGAFSTATLLVSLNNTPPEITITSPVDGSHYDPPPAPPFTLPLTVTITDAEHGPDDLQCQWQTILHHNEHSHPEPYDPACAAGSLVTPLGCDGDAYFYEAVLTVMDAHGLATTVSSFIYPDCSEPTCPPDWDRDGTLNSNDFFAFLVDYFAGSANFDGHGGTDSNDFFAFLGAYFEGCE